jgi:sigma-B regulation protein RsbU (phosphoserine phosphatase)
VKRLEKLLPICMYCKKIRDEENSWQQIESYISSHSDAEFSHAICAECYAKNCEPQFEGMTAESGFPS